MILLKKMWHDERFKFTVFSLFMFIGSALQVLLWPTFSKLLPAMTENIPEPFRGMFSEMASQGFAYFIITQQFLKLIGLFGSFFVALLAASALVRELENRTMGLLLAQPIKRERVFFEKYLFGALLLFLVVVASTVILSPAAQIINEDLDFWNSMLAAITGYWVLLFLYSLTFTVSLYLEDQMQTITFSIGVAIAMSLLVIFQETKYLSIYYLLDGDVLLPVLNNGVVPWLQWSLMIALTIVALVPGIMKFRKMNL
jgi:ABC-type transport system involved in multi-copper enzyme maturation permease subunit